MTFIESLVVWMMALTGQIDMDAVPRVAPANTEVTTAYQRQKKEESKDDDQPTVLTVDFEWSKKISNGL